LVWANPLILSGTLVAAVVVGAPLPLADQRGHWLPLPVALVFAAPALTLAGTVLSGWLTLREPGPRDFWSRIVFTLGILLSLVETGWILWVVLGIGAA
jgi:hypothetical protein